MKTWSYSLCLIASLILATSSHAQIEIPLSNNSFESPDLQIGFVSFNTPDWSTAAVQNLAEDGTFFSLGAPRGKQHLVYLNSPSANVTRSVTTTVVPGRSYVLSFLFGQRLPDGGGSSVESGYRIEFYVDASLVTDRTDPHPTFPDDTYRRVHATYTHPVDAAPGNSLEFRIISTEGNPIIDDVHLYECNRYTSAPSDLVSSFESYIAGSAPITNFDENWVGDPGSATSHVVRTAPAFSEAGMPTQGANWLEVSNLGTGVGSAETVSRVRSTFYAETQSLAFDFNFLTNDDFHDTIFGDDARVVVRLLDGTPGGTIIIDEDLVNAMDTAFTFGPSTSSSGISPFISFGAELTSVLTHRLNWGPEVVGHPIEVTLEVYNRVDSSFDSALYVDNFRFEPDLFRSGSGEGFVLGTGVSQPLNLPFGTDLGIGGGAGQAVRYAQEGNTLSFSWHDHSGDFIGSPVLLIGELLNSGSYPAGSPSLGYHLSVGSAFFLAGSLSSAPFTQSAFVSADGETRHYVVPAFLSGKSLLVQALAVSGAANNGFFAATAMHEVIFP